MKEVEELKAMANSGNGKVYSYKDGTKKVFVNNKPVEITSERLLKLAEKVIFTADRHGEITCMLKKDYKNEMLEKKGDVVNDVADFLLFDFAFDGNIDKYLGTVENKIKEIED